MSALGIHRLGIRKKTASAFIAMVILRRAILLKVMGKVVKSRSRFALTS